MKHLILLSVLGLIAVGVTGCSGSSEEERAAPTTTSTGHQPANVEGFKKERVPPLSGPNAGQGGGNF